ncbi:TIGR04376 family protein [Waterburya agarophytonicola K14]|uniref:TIGR04376 family protein n=1 Tax=Waterburya agarophytonicola KI4 TaxID=2874699 RepID=A0A964BV73_9CYAN|nr:TIGR04376 family protein [Waterburya agarophytonicola]MCC0178415.1 TIGR04376 family protein [Waterburya agarophytonicola KI4]
MGLFDDINNFLEERLDEFLRNNPHLELQAIEEQLLEQEQDTKKLIAKLQLEEKSLQDRILEIATSIQTWHGRIGKAETAKRPDLAGAAREREAELLRQGNQIWGQMEGVKQRTTKAKELLVQIKQKREEVKTQSTQAKTSQTSSQYSSDTVGWDRGANSASNSRNGDPLEAEFQQWEVDEELERIKRNMNSKTS